MGPGVVGTRFSCTGCTDTGVGISTIHTQMKPCATHSVDTHFYCLHVVDQLCFVCGNKMSVDDNTNDDNNVVLDCHFFVFCSMVKVEIGVGDFVLASNTNRKDV